MELVTEASIICIGEAMLELRPASPAWQLGFAGDTLNTAIHMARGGGSVRYMTAVGADAMSSDMVDAWRMEGIDCSLVLTHPSRTVGLYAIATDDRGERSFTYWRDSSAARQLFALPDAGQALEQAAKADFLYFSLISLAIVGAEGRDRLFSLARQVRANGGKVAFDSNYRPNLWSEAAEARMACEAAIALCDIGLPTLEDEQLLGHNQDAKSVQARWQAAGCAETIVKLGAKGCLLPDGGVFPPPASLNPVDTSGAGDAFNAGYLLARSRGAMPAAAAAQGHQLAGWTIMRRGAIPAQDDIARGV